MASEVDEVQQAAHRVNTSLMEYIVSLSDYPQPPAETPAPSSSASAAGSKEGVGLERRQSIATSRSGRPNSRDADVIAEGEAQGIPPTSSKRASPEPKKDLDYAAAVNALTLQFSNEQEVTRVVALTWLIMLHRKSPRKV